MLIPVKDAEEYERLIPDARKVVLADTGHMAMVERPPTFNRLLLEFLDEPRGEQTDDVGEPTAETDAPSGANGRSAAAASGASPGNGRAPADDAGADSASEAELSGSG
jgi:hypothetical protein